VRKARRKHLAGGQTETEDLLDDSVGTECTLVHCSLYTGCIYRVLTPRELRNQVVNLRCFAIDSMEAKNAWKNLRILCLIKDVELH
jgi:hypothetical protein